MAEAIISWGKWRHGSLYRPVIIKVGALRTG